MKHKFNCDNCGTEREMPVSHYKKRKYHFCNRQCYSAFRRDKLPKEEQNAWKGGIDPRESERMYRERNKAKVKAMNNARKLRELNAEGHHTKHDWELIKESYNNECAEKDDTCRGAITKDHEVPLVMGGTNWPSNIGPLCKSHNSRKARKVYLGQFELPDTKNKTDAIQKLKAELDQKRRLEESPQEADQPQ